MGVFDLLPVFVGWMLLSVPVCVGLSITYASGDVSTKIRHQYLCRVWLLLFPIWVIGIPVIAYMFLFLIIQI